MKPCPFCGYKPDPDNFPYGVHYNTIMKKWLFDHTCHFDMEGLDVVMTVYGKTRNEVIERWNRRAEVEASESL